MRPINAIDRHVGARAQIRRQSLGMEHADVATKLQVEPSVVLDYEAGRERISASTLFELCRILDVGADYFFKELDSTNRNTDALPAGDTDRKAR